VRVVLADDTWLIREGLTRVLAAAGHEVVGLAAGPDEVPPLVASRAPDVAVLDIKMPPSHTDEGLRLAAALRVQHPDLPILLLSQYVEPGYATALLTLLDDRRCGYLLKDSVLDGAQFDEALRRLRGGQVVLDPAVVRLVLDAPRRPDPLTRLTRREREILGLMAEGRSDRGIAERLFVSLNTVGTHIQHILAKLELNDAATDNRRVLAVLHFLGAV
jgi:DNA-binding NarL/FixJ family response regulator